MSQMAKKGNFSCGLEAVLAMIGGKWKFLILFHLARGTTRFGELRRLIVGISEKMLIQGLKEMIADGLVFRRDFHEVPPRVEYSLTRFGRSLATALAPLCDWGTLHTKRIGEMQRAPVARTKRRAARKAP
jgi:DNA-binding HxlR family transcriptional regulator